MGKSIKNKILLLGELIEKVEALKLEGKTVVQSHGVFDLIHPGIIKHLNDAKEKGDMLIVTVIKDKSVRKGYGRPVFPEQFRLENVASLEQVDYACIVNDDTPFNCIKDIKPDIFAKGKSYRERDRKIHERIFEDKRGFYFEKTRICETEGFSFSSSHLINNSLDIYPEETRKFLKDISQKYDFNDIVDNLNRLKDKKVLLIGDGIIDEYFYCETMGKSPKAQLVVNKYNNHEIFAGGVYAIANHVAGICQSVHVVSLLGKEESREAFILKNLKPNIDAKFFYREDGPTVVKRRYINQYQNQKTFEINYINDNFINNGLNTNIIEYLKSILNIYDIIMVSDFGHGFITDKTIRFLEAGTKKLAVNAQTNGANAGYNLITKYSKTDFISLDVAEARLATQEKYEEISIVAKELLKNLDTNFLIITLGSEGSLCINRKGETNHTPAFAAKVVDIIGAGDAYFSYTAPCFAIGMPMDLVAFIGNVVGALAVQIVGNKQSVEKYEVLEFINTILKH